MSPRCRTAVSAPRALLSSIAAAADSLRESNTPTATQPVPVRPGCTFFMLNCKRCSRAETLGISLIIHTSFRKSKASMIFHKALVRELATAGLAAFLVLLGITLTMQLVKLLGQAATGVITTGGVLALLG